MQNFPKQQLHLSQVLFGSSEQLYSTGSWAFSTFYSIHKGVLRKYRKQFYVNNQNIPKKSFFFLQANDKNTEWEVKTMNYLQSIWKIKYKIQNLATNGLAGELY